MVVVKSNFKKIVTPFDKIMSVENKILQNEHAIITYYLKGVTRQAGSLADVETKRVTLRTAKYLSEALETTLQDVQQSVAISEIRFEAVESLVSEIRKEIALTLSVGGDGVPNFPIEQSMKNINNFAKIRSDKFIDLDLTTHVDVLGENSKVF